MTFFGRVDILPHRAETLSSVAVRFSSGRLPAPPKLSFEKIRFKPRKLSGWVFFPPIHKQNGRKEALDPSKLQVWDEFPRRYELSGGTHLIQRKLLDRNYETRQSVTAYQDTPCVDRSGGVLDYVDVAGLKEIQIVVW